MYAKSSRFSCTAWRIWKSTHAFLPKGSKDESRPIYARLNELYTDGNALDEAIYDLACALTAYEETYLELGMIAGARLTKQLLG